MSIRAIFQILLENRQGRHLEKAPNTWDSDQNLEIYAVFDANKRASRLVTLSN